MRSIDRRLDKIERHNGRCRTAFVWREQYETADQAIERHLADRPDDLAAELVVIGWQRPA